MNKIFTGNCLNVMQSLKENSVHCCVTSPPYYVLRDYKVQPSEWPEVTFSLLGFPVTVMTQTCCLGMEKTPIEYIGHLVAIFREVNRVLRKDGTLWLNIGDSYASWPKDRNIRHASTKSTTFTGSLKSQFETLKQQTKIVAGLKEKDLLGIPWMLALALRDDGWYLRQDIIWSKPNCMPESVRDRCTKAHEYVFMFSKSKKYYYDHEAIKTEAKESSVNRVLQNTINQIGTVSPEAKKNGAMKAVLKELPEGQNHLRKARDKQRGHSRAHTGFNGRWDQMSRQEQMSYMANKRSVWSVPPAHFEGDHFAVFPEELIWDMIKAGCPVDGTVLDPFGGRGTTAVVARKQDKNYILVEMSEKNVAIAEKYIWEQLGFFK